jgi:hypothetical protein
MMKTRTVKFLLPAHTVDMGGMPVRQPFPTQKVDQIDPFLLLHHADIKVPKHIDVNHAGVGPHPHRGFSPVTFIFKGGVHHRDSRGNNSIVYEGGAQWMNAGMGVIHSERPPKDIHEMGGRQEIIQLWINTPAEHKMDTPFYYPISAKDAPAFKSNDNKVTAQLFSGELFGLQSATPTLSSVNAATFSLTKDAAIEIPFPENHNALLYLLDGKIQLGGYGLVDGLNAIVFNNDGAGITINALEDTRALFLSGIPLNEKVVSHGPFVMNSQTEILEAMRDYQMGRMGVLIEE